MEVVGNVELGLKDVETLRLGAAACLAEFVVVVVVLAVVACIDTTKIPKHDLPLK